MSEPKLFPVASSLGLATADRIADGAIAAAGDAGLLPVTIAVVDAGGQLVVLKRQDGCGIVRGEIAIAKACAALGMGQSSRTLGDRLDQRPAFQAAISAASGGRFAAVPGGVLILDDAGAAVGAVGISGDASDRDEYAAIIAIQGAGLASAPAEPVTNWQDAGL